MKKVLLWTTLAVVIMGGFAAFVGLLVNKLTPQPVEPLPVRPAIADATFADGHRLEILLHGVGTITDGSTSAPRSGFMVPRSTGSSSRGFGSASTTVHTVDSVITGISFTTNNHGDLLLQLRLIDSHGDPVNTERYIKNWKIMSESGSWKDRPEWKSGSAAIMTQADADATKWPEVVVQVSDGAGGWITGDGLIKVDGDLEHRCGMAFQGWPRTSDPLVFRALRPACPPVEFHLPNPSPAKAPAKWTASPFPQTHKDPDFTLTLKHVHELSIPERGHFLAPSHDFQSRFPNDDSGDYRSNKLSCEFIDIEGALGSQGRKTRLEVRNGIVSAAPIPPDESLFRARFRVARQSAFPRPLADAQIIAEAELGADGKTLTTTWRSTSHGCKTVTLSNVSAKRGRQAFDFDIEFEWTSHAARSTADAAFGSWDDLVPVVFIDGHSESEGSGDLNDQGSSSAGSHSDASFGGNWFGPLKPNQKIKIGLIQPLPPTEVLFTFDRAAITK